MIPQLEFAVGEWETGHHVAHKLHSATWEPIYYSHLKDLSRLEERMDQAQCDGFQKITESLLMNAR